MCMLNLDTLFFRSSKSSATCNTHSMGIKMLILYKMSMLCMCAHCIYLSDTFDLNAVLFAPFQFILTFGKNKGVRVRC